MTEAEMKGLSILVVEDELMISLDVERELALHGASVTCANSIVEAKYLLRSKTFHGAIIDSRVKDGTGADLLPDLAAIPYVIYSGHGTLHFEIPDHAIHVQKPDQRKAIKALLKLVGDRNQSV